MVVLEGGGMLSSGSNQYLQPDYLSPLPTTLDAKKSPLALLAQTCSQIGADSPSSKPIIPPIEKPKKESEKPEKVMASREPERLAFKPYETTKKEERPSSKSSHTGDDEKKSGSRTPGAKSVSPHHVTAAATTPGADGRKSSDGGGSRGKSESPSASPIIRSGLEVLQGHPKDLPLGTYKPGSLLTGGLGVAGLTSLSSLCGGCPPGLETNPALRPSFAALSAAHSMGYPPTSLASAAGPYVSYARVKTATGGEALVPVCKDPYCTGCQFSVHNAQLLGATCPSGCSQCDHQKFALGLSLLPGFAPPGPPPSAALSYSQLTAGRPYVCNWIAGDSYCGKRFSTSDELLQHLRTHTNLSSSADVASTFSLLNPAITHHSLLTNPALHRGYPNPPLSPLSAARYHPYSKPGLPGSLGGSPFSAFNPAAAGLAPYYCSPYSIYGQRIGAAVHP